MVSLEDAPPPNLTAHLDTLAICGASTQIYYN